MKNQVKNLAITARMLSDATTAGRGSHAITAGPCSHATTAGRGSHAITAGPCSHATTAGRGSHAITASLASCAATEHQNSVACSLGVRGKARAAEGGFLVLADWRALLYLNKVHVIKVGDVFRGTQIIPGVYYCFEEGELREVSEKKRKQVKKQKTEYAITAKFCSDAFAPGRIGDNIITDDYLNVVKSDHNAAIITTGKESNVAALGPFSNAITCSSSHASTTEIHSNAVTVEAAAHASTLKKYSNAVTAGREAYAITAGPHSHAITTGDESRASIANQNSIACSLGSRGKASAGEGGYLVIADWRDDRLERVYSIKVGETFGGTLIKPDTYYYFDDGKLKEDTL